MPGNAKQRKRKHRGTQTGKIDSRGRTGRPRNRQEAMSRARQKKGDRRLQPPTWRGALMRGGFFALLLLPISLLFGQPLPGAIALTVLAAAAYVPLGFYTDGFFYRRKLAKMKAEQQARKEARGT